MFGSGGGKERDNVLKSGSLAEFNVKVVKALAEILKAGMEGRKRSPSILRCPPGDKEFSFGTAQFAGGRKGWFQLVLVPVALTGCPSE